MNVHHRGFVNDENIGLKRIVLAGTAAVRRARDEPLVNRAFANRLMLGLSRGVSRYNGRHVRQIRSQFGRSEALHDRLTHAACSLAGGCRERDAQLGLFGKKALENLHDRCCLPGPGPARNDGKTTLERKFERLALQLVSAERLRERIDALERLGAQPSLRQQIKLQEPACELELFERLSRKIEARSFEFSIRDAPLAKHGFADVAAPLDAPAARGIDNKGSSGRRGSRSNGCALELCVRTYGTGLRR